VLIRAYQLTGQEIFRQAAWRAVCTFEHDILDGGISTPVGEDGLFFEEIGAYPATHTLSGCILGLFGLYDYLTITGDRKLDSLIVRGLTGLYNLVDAFDTGRWTYTDLLHKHLASRSQHAFHILLLEALAGYPNCELYAKLAARWATYPYRWRYQIRNDLRLYRERALRSALHCSALDTSQDTLAQVYVPIQAFPIPGGMKSVLAGVAGAMEKRWQMTYLTCLAGDQTEGLAIELFGCGNITSPWQFPNVWCYCVMGGYRLFRVLRRRPDVKLILSQDGLYSAAFAVVVGKLLGTRVVCMDHGSITCLVNTAFRSERMSALETYSMPQRLVARLRYACYWSSLRLLARLATHWADHFLIAGDEVEAVYRQQLGVPASRITRYAYTVDTITFSPLAKAARTKIRSEQGLAEDAIIITLINRLALEKGLNFAIEGIARALAELPPEIRQRVKVLIAGAGPLRSQVEADIMSYGIATDCILWGEAKASDVVMLLGITDIFLYSGTRGTNYSMAVLEAMASGCAIVASSAPQSNIRLLADGRGFAILPADAQAIGIALMRLCSDQALRRQMGQSARTYIEIHHSAATLQRTLSRIAYFIPHYEKRS
jgi:glycosyltransferase involved in cell wall biosynthesis